MPTSPQPGHPVASPEADTPDDLWWGLTTSSLACEGAAPAADWARWERLGRVPPSSDGNGFAADFRDDVELFAQLGFDHLRLTLEWARLEPEPGKTDATAIDHYLEVLRATRAAGLRVVATLVHTTLPGWFADDAGSFRDARSRQLVWPRHVDRCAELYGDLVDVWVPIDDPIGWALRGHHLGTRPPGRRDTAVALEAAEGAVLADHEAWRLLASGTAPVMCVRSAPTVFARGRHADEQVGWWRRVLWDSWIGALRDGELVLPDRPPLVVEGLEGSFDLVGVTADAPIALDAGGRLHRYPPDARADDTGFAPWPEELGATLQQLAERLPDRVLVVAGAGVTTDDDDWREEVVRGWIGQLEAARRDGIAVRGWFCDTAIDGYDGARGHAGRRGIIDRDRRPKSSALWLQANRPGR